ncbi:MAG TPA: hypothetical protein VGF18_07995 [Candidatus Tumulicola sp.]
MMLFFASSGMLQIFNLHQSHGNYTAPAIVQLSAGIHKDQEVRSGPPGGREGGPPAGALGAQRDGAPQGRREEAWSLPRVMLKWLFFLEACGFVATLLFGIWIGLTHAKRRGTVIALLVAGSILPAVLVAWQTLTPSTQ